MIHAFYSLLPLMVTLVWSVIYILRWTQLNRAQRSVVWYLLANAVYYSCTSYYMFHGMLEWIKYPWIFTFYALEPLLYFIILRYTTKDQGVPKSAYLLMVPAVAGLFAQAAVPSFFGNMPMLSVMYLITAYVLGMSIWRTLKFRKQILNGYSDYENRTMRPVRILLYCMVVLSILIFYVNTSPTALVPKPLLYFCWIVGTFVKFSIYYIFFTYSFTVYDMNKEIGEEPVDPIPNLDRVYLNEDISTDDRIYRDLTRLMEEEHIYLQQDIKITDLAKIMGTNRTYLSRYINKNYQLSFSDFININRIQHAEKLMLENPNVSRISLAVESGYSSVQSFMNNFRKFSGKRADRISD